MVILKCKSEKSKRHELGFKPATVNGLLSLEKSTSLEKETLVLQLIPTST